VTEDPAAIGTRYGNRVIIGPADSTTHRRKDRPSPKRVSWVMARCDCGDVSRVRLDYLRAGRSTKCKACAKFGPPIEPGTRFGQRVVVRMVEPDDNRNRRVLMRCDCGDESVVLAKLILRGDSLSCNECSRSLRRVEAMGKRRGEYRSCRNRLGVRPCHVRRCWMWLDHPEHSCALDVAAEGDHTLEYVAAMIGVTRERARQIEQTALAKLKTNPWAWAVWELGFCHPHRQPPTVARGEHPSQWEYLQSDGTNKRPTFRGRKAWTKKGAA